MRTFNNQLRLMPDGNDNSAAPGLTQVSELEVVEIQPSTYEQEMAQGEKEVKPVDWSKEEGKPLDTNEFLTGQPSAKPKEVEVEKEVESEVAKEQQQEQVDDTSEDRREPPVKEQQQQQVEEPPIYKRFPEAKVFLKKMSNEAREFTVARLNDIIAKEAEVKEQAEALTLAQQGRQKIPDNYYENPNAIVLLPEFQRASFHTTLAEKIANHWNKQYESILEGEEWQDLEEIMDKSGNIVDVKPSATKVAASGSAQAMVGKYVRQAERQFELLSQHQEKLVGEFKQTVAAKIGGIRKAEDEFFPPEKYNKEGSPETTLTKQVSEGLRKIGITEANPAFGMLAKAGATILQLREYIQHNSKGAGRAESIAAKAKQAGPTGNMTKQAGGGKVNEEEDTMADFNKILINKR